MKLKEYLNEREISQSELVLKAGIGHSTLSQYLNGVRDDVNFDTARKIAKALGITLDELSDLTGGDNDEEVRE